MATVNILPAFTYKWAQDATVEAIDDAQYKAGWAFIGATPPSVEQFNKVHQVQDEKSNYLYAQMKAIYDAAGVVPAAGTLTSLLDSLRVTGGGIIGIARNVRAQQAAAGTSLTVTADQVVLANSVASGNSVKITSLNSTVNLATVGANGMDTGLAPVSGWVAIYAITNASTGAKALLGVDATAARAPEAYAGLNMPVGYTHSALIAVLPTNASRQIPRIELIDRNVYYYTLAYSGAGFGSITSLSIANSIPKNAKRWWGNAGLNNTVAGTQAIVISAQSTGSGAPGYELVQGYAAAGAGTGGTISSIPVFTQQTMWFNNSSNNTVTINIYGYEF